MGRAVHQGFSLRFELVLYVSLIMLVSLGLNVVVMRRIYQQASSQQRFAQVKTLSEAIRLSIEAVGVDTFPQLTESQRKQLIQVVERFAATDQVRDCQLTDRQFRRIPLRSGDEDLVYRDDVGFRRASVERETVISEDLAGGRGGQGIVITAPFFSSNRIMGYFRLRVVTPDLLRDVLTAEKIALFIFPYLALNSLLMAILGTLLLSRAFVRPIHQLINGMERVTSGDMEQTVRVVGSQEILQLGAAFNEMLQKVREMLETEVEQKRQLEKSHAELLSVREEISRQERLASVGRLAAGVAHEIGNPAAAILGYTEMLRRGKTDEESRLDCLARVEQEAIRIRDLLRDLLDFAKPRPARSESVDLNQLIQQCLDLLAGQGRLKGVHLTTRLAGDLLGVAADRIAVQQLLINLLLNAIDAVSLADRPALQVLTANTPLRSSTDIAYGRTAVAKRTVLIEIADNGVGIPEEELSQIFDPFFTTKAPGKGTGLGLAIVARTIDLLGGRIEVESTVEEGTTFRIFFPIG